MTDTEKLDLLLSQMIKMQDDITDIRKDVTDIRGDVTDIKLHLENVTDRNIQIVAEGHMNLNSRLLEDGLVTISGTGMTVRWTVIQVCMAT